MKGRPRTFDYHEARRLRAEGVTYQAIADKFGVSDSAVYLAVNPDARAKMIERGGEWQRRGICIKCGGPCTRTAGQPAHRCRRCFAIDMAVSVREGELQCVKCRDWKPDTEFPRSRAEPARRGRHSQCRACTTEAKRIYREKTKVPCSGGCGTLVTTVDRRDKSKPPRCLPCAMQAVYGYTTDGHAALGTRRDTAA